jgi:hypothetical protein
MDSRNQPKIAALQRKRALMENQATDVMSSITHLKYEISKNPNKATYQSALQNKERELSNIKKNLEQIIAQLNALT